MRQPIYLIQVSHVVPHTKVEMTLKNFSSAASGGQLTLAAQPKFS